MRGVPLTVSILVLVAAQSALGLGVRVGTNTFVPFAPGCTQSGNNVAASCSSAGAAGLAQAGADPFFNGGVRAELYVDPGMLLSSGARITFAQSLVNTRPQPQALLVRSILLPGRVFVAGDAGAQLFVGLSLSINGSAVERIASQAFMVGDSNGNTTWQNPTMPTLDQFGPGTRWAGVPSNWPQDGPVTGDVALPFSVLDFNFNRLINPGEQFTLTYLLAALAGPAPNPVFVEAVLANIGDPLNLAQTPLIEFDQSIFAPVPEPNGFLLLCLGVAGLLASGAARASVPRDE